MQFNGHTLLLGLIGDPVAQARTPGMANTILDQRGKLGPYVLTPMHVAPDNLTAFITGIRTMKNFCGAVVTMPHKTNMALLVDELTPEAQMVGAVNVIRRESDGRLVGTVLDGEGFVGGLLSAGHTIAGKACVLVGAGGAASAIAFSLVKHGCGSLYLLNRTQTKANDLAQRLKDAFPGVAVSTALPYVSTALPYGQAFDMAINATSLGMKPEDRLPMEEALIDRTSLVAECVIAPEITALLEVAKRKGCQVHTGVSMLSAQMSLMLGFMGVR
jgi:shikimate dehydrogenase